MTMRTALKAVLVISLIGVAFSGTLTYREVAKGLGGGCTVGGVPGTIFGYPVCVYGLVMYLVLVAVSALGLRSER